MNNFEEMKIFFTNFLKSFKYSGAITNGNYSVNYARPERRLLAFLVDSVIIYTLVACFIFIVVKKDIIKELDIKNEVESSFEIDANNNISNLKNIEIVKDEKTQELSLQPVSKEEKNDKINNIIFNKIYSNKLCRHMIILIPLIYHILYLMTKKRATVGQQLFNLLVIKKDGSKLEFGDVVSRVFLFSICKMLFLMPFTIIIPILKSKEKITLYDYFTDTRVIEFR